jgi:F-type H+-transporting ATPase subunit a
LAYDPIHQFHIEKIIPIEIGGFDISFTNSALFMVLTVAAAALFLIPTTGALARVPVRWPSAPDITYEFISNKLRE